MGLMKTTVELPEQLLINAKKRATELRRSLRSLLEDALRHELARLDGRPVRTIEEVRASIEPFQGTVLEYTDPTTPVDEDDWDALT